jgi:hypothetical protein
MVATHSKAAALVQYHRSWPLPGNPLTSPAKLRSPTAETPAKTPRTSRRCHKKDSDVDAATDHSIKVWVFTVVVVNEQMP